MLTIEQIKTLINGLKQGIDSAIREAEKKTESVIAEVNKSIRGVLKRANEAAERADYAFDEAEQARYEAGLAKTAADEALPIITVSRISGGTGEVYEYMPLRDGAVFSLRSTVEGPYSSDPAYLRYNGGTYPIYARNPSMYSLQGLEQIVGNESASRVFRVGMVTLMQYSSTRRAFISLNSYDMREFVRFTTINPGGDPNGGFVMAEKDEDGVVSSLRLRKYPSIPSTSEGSSKRLELRVNDDGMLKTIDPDGGTVSVIPAIAHAEVGQIVRVSAVSESGTPTAWEAVDMPGLHRALRLTLTENVAVISVTGLSLNLPVTIALYNAGAKAGLGIALKINGVEQVGYAGTLSSTTTERPQVMVWLFTTSAHMAALARMSNGGRNNLWWQNIPKAIESIEIDSPYRHNGVDTYFQSGTMLEIYEGACPSVYN